MRARPQKAEDIRTREIPIENNDDNTAWIIPEGSDLTLFIIDAFALLYRSYYALSKTTMSSREMFDTRAVYGFTMVVTKFLEAHAKGNPVAVVFEGRRLKDEKDFRTALYPSYKGDRGPTPTGIVEAVPWVKAVCKAMGLTLLEIDRFEADDTIGTLVKKVRNAGAKCVVVSNDKDFRQLLEQDYVSILRLGTQNSYEYVSEQSFREEFAGLHPRQYVDVLTLIGDKADGLKGVPGIGARTAPRLIAQYGSLESLLDAVREYFRMLHDSHGASSSSKRGALDGLPLITARVAKSLKESEQHALLVKRLITVKEDLPLTNLKWETFRRKPVHKEETMNLMKQLEFSNSSLIRRVLSSADNVAFIHEEQYESETASDVTNSSLDDLRIRLVDEDMTAAAASEGKSASSGHIKGSCKAELIISPSNDQIEAYVRDTSRKIGISPIFERSGKESRLRGIVLYSNPARAIVVHIPPGQQLHDGLATLLRDRHVEKRGWFLKELYKGLLDSCGLTLGGRLFDIRIAAELLHAGEKITDSKLASLYMEEGILDSLILDGHHRISVPSSAEEASLLCHVALKFSDELERGLHNAHLTTVIDSVELPLIPVLAEMELAGVPIDVKSLSEYEKFVRCRVESIGGEIGDVVAPYVDSDVNFRATSRDDVASLLFNTWKMETKVSRTKRGKYSVSKNVLTALANDHHIGGDKRNFARLMLEHREATKILNTYTASLISAVRPDGRIRCTFMQEAASTGRLSTSNPNLQSLPVRSTLGRRIRGMVKATDGFSILCADYSQIEMRIIASLCGDVALRSVLSSGDDIHAYVAAKVFRVSRSEVTEEQRRKAKEVNYGISYGISAYGLGQQLGVSTRDAQVLISQFHEEFPLIAKLSEELIRDAKKDGYARTLLGRRLNLPLLAHGGPQERKAAERIAVNMPIQGTQADMMKLAMIRIANRLQNGRASSRLIMQLHDELVLEVENSEVPDVVGLVREEMVTALPLNGVDVVVNTGFGASWLHATK